MPDVKKKVRSVDSKKNQGLKEQTKDASLKFERVSLLQMNKQKIKRKQKRKADCNE